MIRSRSSSLLRLALTAAPLAAVLSIGTSAQADEKCPPGSWFCADADIKIGTPPAEIPPAQPPPVVQQPPPAQPPPVIIYQPAPPPPVYNAPPPQEYYPPPPPPSQTHAKSEVGLSFRLEGAAFHSAEQNKGRDASMGGLGVSLRFRPVPRFALDIGLDALAGTDANGFKRSEQAVSVVGLLYLNPRSKVQVYLLGGFGFSGARVENDQTAAIDHYSYFGGIFGGGLEFRLAPRIALNFDVRGFVRGRTDDAAATRPEFTAADGRTTNTSGGALFTGGLTFYF